MLCLWTDWQWEDIYNDGLQSNRCKSARYPWTLFNGFLRYNVDACSVLRSCFGCFILRNLLRQTL